MEYGTKKHSERAKHYFEILERRENMAQHDRYETDILKQLTRIANALEKIEKKTQNPVSSVNMKPDGNVEINYKEVESTKVEEIPIDERNCVNCGSMKSLALHECYKCINCCKWVPIEEKENEDVNNSDHQEGCE